MPGGHYRGSARCLLLFILLVMTPVGIPLPAQNESGAVGYSAYLEEAQTAMAAGEYEEAIQAFKKANQIRGNESPRCLFSLGWLYSELGDHEQAVRAYRRLFQLSLGESIHHLQRLTVAYYRAGRPESAVEACRAFINKTQKRHLLAPAYNELGCWLLVRDGSAREALNFAEAVFLEALELSGGRANNARFNLAEVLWRQGRKDESINLLYSLVDPETAKPWRDLRLINISEEIAEHAVQVSGIEPVAALKTPESANQDPYDAPAGPPPQLRGCLAVGGNVKAPARIRGRQPQYTEEARQARLQGVVVVELLIDEDGKVARLKVLEGLPMGLSEASTEALKSWEFRPATLNGEPVAVCYQLTVNFRLQ